MNQTFPEFLTSILNLNWDEMIKVADKKCVFLESIKKKEIRNESFILAGKIKGLLFWLRSGAKPAGLSDDDFHLLKPACEKLIEKKQLKLEALDIFLTIKK